jgi:hypothetical protein
MLNNGVLQDEKKNENWVFALLGGYASYVSGYRLSKQIMGPIFGGYAVLLAQLAIEYGPILCPVKTAANHQLTLRNIPEERRRQLQAARNLATAKILRQDTLFSGRDRTGCLPNKVHIGTTDR